MGRTYPGYVYQPFPKMVYSEKYGPLGYKIFNSQEELNKEELVEPVPVRKKPGPKPKLIE